LLPSRSAVNRIIEPSGDQFGFESIAASVVKRVCALPSAFMM
jgi:hypothetical protein